MGDLDDIDGELTEDELDRIFNSGILDYYQAGIAIPLPGSDELEFRGVMYKSSNRRVGCGWNGKELVIGRDCHPEVLLNELAYCLIEPAPVKKQNRPLLILHMSDQGDIVDKMSPEEQEAFYDQVASREFPEELLSLDAKISLLTLIFCRSLGFDTIQQFGELFQVEDPFRYPYDPNSPLDQGSPFLVYENREARNRILKAFKWLKERNYFSSPFTERASQEIEFMLKKMFGYRNLDKWGHINQIPPAAYIDGTYYRLSSHPEVQAQRKNFMSKMSETEYKNLRGESFFIPRITEEDGQYYIYYTPMRRGKRSLMLDQPLRTPDGDIEFESEDGAFEYLVDNLERLPSADLSDYVIVSEQDFEDRIDDDDADDDDDSDYD